jgi:hypothetical protein
MSTYTIAGTGSRSLVQDWGKMMAMVDHLEILILAAISKHGHVTVISGGAEGFDEALLRAALRVATIKPESITPKVYLPYKGYLKYYWQQASMTQDVRYPEMVDMCNAVLGFGGEVRYTADSVVWMKLPQGNRKCAINPRTGNHEEVNNIRNMDMVDAADKMWVYNPRSTGTANCFRYIKQVGKSHHIIEF